MLRWHSGVSLSNIIIIWMDAQSPAASNRAGTPGALRPACRLTPVPAIAPQLPAVLPTTVTPAPKSMVNEDLDEEPEAPLDDSALAK